MTFRYDLNLLSFLLSPPFSLPNGLDLFEVERYLSLCLSSKLSSSKCVGESNQGVGLRPGCLYLTGHCHSPVSALRVDPPNNHLIPSNGLLRGRHTNAGSPKLLVSVLRAPFCLRRYQPTFFSNFCSPKNSPYLSWIPISVYSTHGDSSPCYVKWKKADNKPF